MISKFGQEVTLVVTDIGGTNLIFDASNLRVDFDVRLVDGFSRGTFTIYNLTEATIRVLANGENYVTVTTRLHNSQEYIVAKRFYISNVLEEIKLPNSITTLYCYDSLRKHHLEKQIDISVRNPTLRRQMDRIRIESKIEKEVKYLSFPEGREDQKSGKLVVNIQGTVQSCIARLQNQYGFKLFTDIDQGLTCMYMPSVQEVQLTELKDKKSDLVLDILNMRANPIIGPATLLVTSNLDGRIRPTALLDTSELITVGVNPSELSLQIANNYLKDNVSGFTKYQVIAVQHSGSNYTGDWKTVATAVSPARGKTMPTISWQKGI
jgi:hypothetical protein